MDDEVSEQIKQSNHTNSAITTNNYRQPSSPFLRENSVQEHPASNIKTRAPPRMDSIMSNDSDHGEYKMSFMNNGRSINDQLKAMHVSPRHFQQEQRVGSTQVRQAPSYYERSPAINGDG